MKRTISLILIFAVLFLMCSCGQSKVVKEISLTEFEENGYFSFYYKTEIAKAEAAKKQWKVYYMSADVNSDGVEEDICYFFADGDEGARIDIFDTATGDDIGAKTTVIIGEKTKIRFLSSEHNGFPDMEYAVLDEDSDVGASQKFIFSADGYYTEIQE